MTAGAGIIHSEEPSRRVQREGGRVHGFQVWLNLPARLKMTQPRYQEVPAAGIPMAATADGKAQVRIIAGAALGTQAVIDTHTPITYQDWTLQPGGDASIPIEKGQTALVYVFGGEARVGDAGRAVTDGQLAVLGDGEAVRLRGGQGSGEPARLLLLAGRPLREPMARYGPFVMNTQAEIVQAMRDYQSGRMGEIVRTARIG
jgi:redox-sensitive bicupin YhaK (pirin superfamily)